MADNRPREQEAELFIRAKLLEYDFKIVKPSFDVNGADLLILDSIDTTTTKFLKVQSKLRTLALDRSSSIILDVTYITKNFVLFLYVKRSPGDVRLYTFFAEDIDRWSKVGDRYSLTITERILLSLEDRIFTSKTVVQLRSLLKKQTIRKYTSLIIDGIFLKQALRYTMQLYTKIWPEIVFKRPSISDSIWEILRYSRFNVENDSINCILFLSNQHGLESMIDIPDPRNTTTNLSGIKLSIYKSESIVTFEVMAQLERIINVENVILVADDISYENPLNALIVRGVNLILIKHSEDSGSRMFPDFRWADITRPLGLALGLTGDQL